VDRGSGKLFWYNLRDEQSFWMTADDQQRYKAEMTLDTPDRAMLFPSGATSPRKKMRSNNNKFKNKKV
jgi:hypothetical protein